jgi:hypothetical protein
MSSRLAAYAVCIENERVLLARYLSLAGATNWTFRAARWSTERIRSMRDREGRQGDWLPRVGRTLAGCGLEGDSRCRGVVGDRAPERWHLLRGPHFRRHSATRAERRNRRVGLDADTRGGPPAAIIAGRRRSCAGAHPSGNRQRSSRYGWRPYSAPRSGRASPTAGRRPKSSAPLRRHVRVPGRAEFLRPPGQLAVVPGVGDIVRPNQQRPLRGQHRPALDLGADRTRPDLVTRVPGSDLPSYRTGRTAGRIRWSTLSACASTSQDRSKYSTSPWSSLHAECSSAPTSPDSTSGGHAGDDDTKPVSATTDTAATHSTKCRCSSKSLNFTLPGIRKPATHSGNIQRVREL